MDEATLQAYNRAAASYAQEWSGQAAPEDMYALLLRHFRPGPTADIGCGSGRDTAWLVEQGFDAQGFDASVGLLREARALHPAIAFGQAALPGLEGVERGRYENVLCETVIMHLQPQEIGSAVQNLFDLLRPNGTLYLSWRVAEQASQRDRNGRLYAAFDKRIVVDALGDDATRLFDRQELSVSSGKPVQRLIVRRTGSPTP